MAFRNGHYIDSGLSPEEREKRCKQSEEENAKLKSWDDVPLTCEDQNYED